MASPMIVALRKRVVTVIILFLILLSIGMVVWLFMKESKITFQDILFWVGAAPVAFFSIGLFGDFFGRGNISYQLSRSVSKQSSNQRALQDQTDKKSSVKFGLNCIIAGLLTWLVSYCM
jgi:hypothetical protein